MNYTQDWTYNFIENTKLHNIKNLDMCLEIGVFEGLTSNYICDNILSQKGKLICIDPLLDQYLVDNLSESNVKDNKEEKKIDETLVTRRRNKIMRRF